jgi:choline dehydrogenase-like flavoprotein
MHTDIRNLDNGTVIEGDICIIGAGAAGISIALQWANTRHKVILLEGGGFHYEAQLQDLYRGQIIGQPYYPLESARLHYFGGTTGHWGGFCAPLDPIDFEQRDWVPHSGWPISLDALHPYYARAQHLAELGPYQYDPAWWEQQDPEVRQLPLDPGQIRTKMWQFSPPTKFGDRYRDQIVNATNLHLYTYANVCEIIANESVRTVQELQLGSLDGKQHRVQARYYILACGAIQNTRLLLASNRQIQSGLGNAHDLVGRFFMEHVEMPIADLALTRPLALKMYLLHYGQTKSRGELALTDAIQTSHQCLNGTASLKPGITGDHTQGTFQEFSPEVLAQHRMIQNTEIEPVTAVSAPSTSPAQPQALTRFRNFILSTRHEQSPNPNSRVTLSDENDVLGVPRAKLDWQLTDLDKRSIRTFAQLLGQQFGRSHLGRVKVMDWLLDEDNPSWPSFLSGGWHHMGTTRMHTDPKQGVVDANCLIHGMDNLYVAGSSVFPTGGSCNPTLSLLALSLRLSDHLQEKFR